MSTITGCTCELNCELVDVTPEQLELLPIVEFDMTERSCNARTEDSDADYNRGCELLASGELQEAIEAFTRAIELNPLDAGAYYNRGYAYAVLLKRAGWVRVEHEDGRAALIGDASAVDAISHAIADFTSALELDPEKFAAFGMRAEMYWMTGQRNLAEADTRAAAALGDAAAQEILRTRFARCEDLAAPVS
jgi:tetratricopeptide (TPR) repeat protein